ncbi:MAG TPA: SCO family protein [Blastocatellia bacterium]|nr:SCO family protein [Blastocatellia bacterium]
MRIKSLPLTAPRVSASCAIICLFTFVAYLSPTVAAQGIYPQNARQPAPPAESKPRVLKDVGIDQRLGEQLPLDITLRNENGEPVRLGDFFKEKPVVLSLVYYECPMLCHEVLTGMTRSFEKLSFSVGKEFEVVTVSFDARETPESARRQKDSYLSWYNRAGASEGWHFLTGDQQAIDRLTEAVGFKYAYDEDTKQFAHASGVMVLTSGGKLARYFYGVEYEPKDMRLGLVEASENRIGSPVDQILLYCYHYDPTTGKYGPVVMNILRLAGIITLMAIALLFVVMYRRNTARLREQAEGTF